MPTLSRRILVVLSTLTLVVAGPAAPVFAQSAGDEQYSDPFANSGGGKSKGSGSKSGTSSTPAAAPAPAPVAASPASPPAPTSPTVASLPRTGADLRPLAAAGFVLLVGGLLLVRRSNAVRR